ncbi:MAG: hypothetical protein KJN97_06395 [Deltaproteobacteria bacterium]|nr:hypothetical protein [Deltaproteobacteria bacterium]
MNRNRRQDRRKWLAMAVVLALVSFGCGDTESDGSAPGIDSATGGTGGSAGTRGDSGVNGAGGAEAPNFADALGDNPALFADPLRNSGDFPGTSTDAAEGAQAYAETALACYATPDACRGPECSAFASCCVNTGACCAPVVDNAALPAALDFRGCGALELFDCAEASSAMTTTFGELEPVLNARGLVPNGTADAEGGALVGEPVNLASQRVELDVQFALPVGCSGTCLESAGVAFTATAPGPFVDAEVGLLLSGSRELVNVMIGNEVADSFFAGPGSTEWRLVLSPDGTAELFREGVLQGRYAFDAAALTQAQLVAFGRNLSAPANSAAIASIDVQLADCDNPRAWIERQPISVSIAVSDAARHAFGASPSIVDLGEASQIAYELDGAIYLGERVTPAEVLVAVPAPVLVPSEPDEAMGLEDPELVFDGSNVFLFYTARDVSGAGRVRAAVSDLGLSAFTRTGTAGLVPAGDIISYEAPTVAYGEGLWLLVVRATHSDGATELQAFYTSSLADGWAPVLDGGLERLTRVESATSEITEPSLMIHNSAYQLYYARRSGTRWSVELLVSDELLLWRSLGDVLGGSDEAYDSLGARSPDVISGPGRVDIVYSGQNGVAFRLGTASRTAPSDTAPSIF